MIYFFLSSNSIQDYLYIYGLKSTGERYYNQNNENYKKILSNSKETTLINGVGIMINNKQYIFICQFDETKCQLFDPENNIVFNEDINTILNINYNDFEPISQSYTILNLNHNDKILLSFLERQFLDLSIIQLKKEDNIYFYDRSKNSRKKQEMNNTEIIYNNYSQITCFITERKFIECLIIYNHELKVEIYDESLYHLNSIYLDTIDESEYISQNFHIIFTKCIHLKEEIGIFAYYHFNIYKSAYPLIIQIKELIFKSSNYTLKNVINNNPIFEITIDPTSFSNKLYASIYRVFLIKVSDNKFSYAYVINENNVHIILTIFDLYGNNKDNLLIRYYKINLIIYNLVFSKFLNLFKLNSFLGMAFIGYNNTEYILKTNNDNTKGYFTIFGYSSKKNIDHIELEIYRNNQGFILELNNYFSIDNNLFGYELEIKISSIQNKLKGIKFFSINENKELKINDIINVNDKIIFDISAGEANIQIGEKYVIEMTSIISTPEYNKFIQFYDKREEYGENFENYYQRKIMEEKIFKIKIYFTCHD